MEVDISYIHTFHSLKFSSTSTEGFVCIADIPHASWQPILIQLCCLLLTHHISQPTQVPTGSLGASFPLPTPDLSANSEGSTEGMKMKSRTWNHDPWFEAWLGSPFHYFCLICLQVTYPTYEQQGKVIGQPLHVLQRLLCVITSPRICSSFGFGPVFIIKISCK